MSQVIWLFCHVIDNLGDVGVSWRLARELRTRLNGQVYLFIDDVKVLHHIAPDVELEEQIVIKKWQENQWADCEDVPVPDVVIEMFACRLPENVLRVMKANRAIWLNWEYLSAEDWAVKTHGMLSLQSDGYPKYFWQMGFVAESGGLLRENTFRLPEKDECALPRKILWFGYESEFWANCLVAWQELAVALGMKLEIDVFGKQVLSNLPSVSAFSHLKISEKMFVPQVNFDDLLAQYDVLFVRGEDSFVRAQWSGKPFLWHIYPQAERAHEVKLSAFWQLYYRQQNRITSDWQLAHQRVSDDLNGVAVLAHHERVAAWRCVWQDWSMWQQASWDWQEYLLKQSDSLSRLTSWLTKITQSQH